MCGVPCPARLLRLHRTTPNPASSKQTRLGPTCAFSNVPSAHAPPVLQGSTPSSCCARCGRPTWQTQRGWRPLSPTSAGASCSCWRVRACLPVQAGLGPRAQPLCCVACTPKRALRLCSRITAVHCHMRCLHLLDRHPASHPVLPGAFHGFSPALVLFTLHPKLNPASWVPYLSHVCCPAGAFRAFSPALVLSILDPKLTWSEADQQAAVQQVGGSKRGAGAQTRGNMCWAGWLSVSQAVALPAPSKAACTPPDAGYDWRDAPPSPLSPLQTPNFASFCSQTLATLQGVVVRKSDGSGLSPYDLKRLQAYANSLVDHHLILDLVPPLAANYFAGRLPAPLSYSQAAILAAVGLQQHEIGKVALGLAGGPEAGRGGPAMGWAARLGGRVRLLMLRYIWGRRPAMHKTRGGQFDLITPAFAIGNVSRCSHCRSWRRRWTCPPRKPWRSSTRCEPCQ